MNFVLDCPWCVILQIFSAFLVNKRVIEFDIIIEHLQLRWDRYLNYSPYTQIDNYYISFALIKDSKPSTTTILLLYVKKHAISCLFWTFHMNWHRSCFAHMRYNFHNNLAKLFSTHAQSNECLAHAILHSNHSKISGLNISSQIRTRYH